MSADGATGAPEGGAPAGDSAPDATGFTSGPTVAELREQLGFGDIEDLAPDPRAEIADVDDVTARRAEKAKDEKKPPAEDDDIAIVKGIEERGRARRARVAQRRREQAAAQPPAARAPAPAAVAGPPAQRPPSPVEAAVRDVLAEMDKLAAADADASAAAGGSAAPDTAARTAALTAVHAKLDTITEGLKATKEGEAKLAALQEQIRAIESDRIIRRHVALAVDRASDELPSLLDPKVLREFNKKHRNTPEKPPYSDAIEMIADKAELYFKKYGTAPDLADLAKRIERKLSGSAPESVSDEKPTPKSKTVSRNDGSPPAARTGPDERTFDEAMEDFNRRFGT